jgi:hypothetical protein
MCVRNGRRVREARVDDAPRRVAAPRARARDAVASERRLPEEPTPRTVRRTAGDRGGSRARTADRTWFSRPGACAPGRIFVFGVPALRTADRPGRAFVKAPSL